jgi:threonine/homoserine/homoserine lactone efflux protein
MSQLLKIFWLGITISFLGSIPLGTLNVAAIHIAVQDGLYSASLFGAGAVLIEIAYTRIALIAMNWMQKQQKLVRLLEWFTILLLLAMATGSFIAAMRKSGLENALPVHSSHPFLLGILLSSTNPMPVSFWFGWSTILLNKGILSPNKVFYNVFVAGIAIGSILGFAVFIFGGNYLVNQVKTNQNILNWLIGTVMLITAFIQLYKTLKRPLRVDLLKR